MSNLATHVFAATCFPLTPGRHRRQRHSGSLVPGLERRRGERPDAKSGHARRQHPHIPCRRREQSGQGRRHVVVEYKKRRRFSRLSVAERRDERPGNTRWSSSYAQAINGAGQVTGLSSNSTFLWTNGAMTDLGPSYGANDINIAGQLVDSYFGSGRLWTPTVPNGSTGTFTDMGFLPPIWPESAVASTPLGINSTRQVVGYQLDVFSGEVASGQVSRGLSLGKQLCWKNCRWKSPLHQRSRQFCAHGGAGRDFLKSASALAREW